MNDMDHSSKSHVLYIKYYFFLTTKMRGQVVQVIRPQPTTLDHKNLKSRKSPNVNINKNRF